ncbi:hypothetical protein EV356DRAFT_499112 [Viridothelium virens]|uniref:Uncharacterized protein n=1 Tax=Viridothelium virens TaxID=1048519 RepID=A0A6A6HEJ7_VIRVR|nr:hypothetical protein EV356DRAFT_499112 [Viridothelium virens]
MVRIIDPEQFEPPVYDAYLVCEVSQSTLGKVQEDWRLGAIDRPNDPRYHPPHNRLNIIDRKDLYGLSPQAIRTRLEEEAEEGEEDDDEGGVKPFIIIDEETDKTRSVWYIDRWLDEEELEDAKRDGDEKVLWRLRSATWELPLSIVNYEIANMDIQEDLENSSPGVFEGEDHLYDQHAPQQPQIIQGEDYFRREEPDAATVIAESGEWEETRNPDDMNVVPKPKRMVRLKADLAREHGLQYHWDWAYDDDEQEDDVPKGGCKFKAKWDMTLRPTVW